jgi:hypothetical protein
MATRYHSIRLTLERQDFDVRDIRRLFVHKTIHPRVGHRDPLKIIDPDLLPPIDFQRWTCKWVQG